MDKWEELYQLAALEVDGKKMPERVVVAKETIRAKLHDLSQDGNDPEERRRLTNALETLAAIDTDAHKW